MGFEVLSLLAMMAATCFLAAGACAALRTQRRLEGVTIAPSYAVLGVVIFMFGATCALAMGGAAAVPGLGLPLVAAGYIATAQRAGLFRIHRGDVEPTVRRGSHLHT